MRFLLSIFVALLLSASLPALGQAGASSLDPKQQKLLDAFVGEYWICGSQTAKLAGVESIKIVRENNTCRIEGMKAWDKCRFQVKNDYTLEDREGHIGKLVLGKLNFKDNSSGRKVLRCDFCYDFFVFVSKSIN